MGLKVSLFPMKHRYLIPEQSLGPLSHEEAGKWLLSRKTTLSITICAQLEKKIKCSDVSCLFAELHALNDCRKM